MPSTSRSTAPTAWDATGPVRAGAVVSALAVYDDVHGWNTDQYLGQGEFYLEYGDIDYQVTCRPATSWPAPACCRIRPRS